MNATQAKRKQLAQFGLAATNVTGLEKKKPNLVTILPPKQCGICTPTLKEKELKTLEVHC